MVATMCARMKLKARIFVRRHNKFIFRVWMYAASRLIVYEAALKYSKVSTKNIMTLSGRLYGKMVNSSKSKNVEISI
jgi:hypothetical protein